MDYAEYKAKRADHWTPASIAHAKSYAPAPALDWQNGRDKNAYEAHFERDGFDVHVAAVYDDESLFDRSQDEGRFVHTRDDHDTYPTAACRARRSYSHDASESSREWNYFRPDETARDVAKYLNKQGYSRGVAWEKAMEQMWSVVDLATSDDLYALGVTVTVSRNGVELGSSSVWGITFLHSTRNADIMRELDDAADGCVDDALDGAKAALAQLVASAS